MFVFNKKNGKDLKKWLLRHIQAFLLYADSVSENFFSEDSSISARKLFD